jgi:hypothetical protein
MWIFVFLKCIYVHVYMHVYKCIYVYVEVEF